MNTSSSSVSENVNHGVVPSACAAGAQAGANTSVYVIGALGYDFGTYARRDAFQAVNSNIPLLTNPDLSNYLVVTPSDAESVIWTININNTPVYAVRAAGAFAKRTYQQLQAYLLDPNIDLISVAGRIADSVTLLNGQVVPVIEADLIELEPWAPSSIVPPAGQFTVSAAPIPAGTQVYLTGEGSLDWSHWGLNTASDRNQKMSATLPGFSIGDQLAPKPWPATRQTGYGATFLWNDGKPTANFAPNPALTPGYLQLGAGTTGFGLSVPADTNLRTLRLYVRNDGGAEGGACALTASLTGFAQPIVDQSLVASPGQGVDGVYTIAFQVPPGGPGAPAPSLNVTWAALKNNLAGLQAATLQVGTVARSSALQSYLDRIHFELRNLGVNAQERALNYAASYAATQVLPRFQSTLLGAMFAQGMMLEGLDVKRNERCRPRGDCWDVLFRFFNPGSKTEWSRPSFRITVDVSLVKPLMVGPLQRWSEL